MNNEKLIMKISNGEKSMGNFRRIKWTRTDVFGTAGALVVVTV